MTLFSCLALAWTRIKAPLLLTVSCLFVASAYFGLTLLAGVLPYAAWFGGSGLFWPVWFVFAGGVAALAALWLVSIQVSQPRCC